MGLKALKLMELQNSLIPIKDHWMIGQALISHTLQRCLLLHRKVLS